MLMQRTQKVVVLIPPAVDPVDPPINIRHTITNREPSFSPARSTVLKPAVLTDTDWNRLP